MLLLNYGFSMIHFNCRSHHFQTKPMFLFSDYIIFTVPSESELMIFEQGGKRTVATLF